MKASKQKHPRSDVGLDYLGLGDKKANYWNLIPAELYEHAIKNKEAILTNEYAIRVLTGQYTGRSPDDRYIVEKSPETDDIDWGKFNQSASPEIFDRLNHKMSEYLQDKPLYIKDVFAGADPTYRLNVRIVSEVAYHALFAHNMFLRPNHRQLKEHDPDFTVLAAPNFKADPDSDGTKSSTFIMCNFDKKMILIGGTLYSGEVKKGIFSVLNYLLPKKDVMPMHCSANMDESGNTAVFFGLSGTGKTTLSSDTDRILIGDDEHGWSDDGIFNFEGGCYAKTIDLDEEHEPLIYNTTKMPGTILENVVLNEDRVPDFFDDSYTQNTRCAYPIHYIPNASRVGIGGHPENIFFLTADAFGVLPPISKLNPEQAMYHFISGYTAKIAGTERGITEPKATFSACFGAPFMPLHPTVYAELLAEKIKKHNTQVWLINTGWTRGPYGVGNRIKLRYTRRMLHEALNGNLKDVEFQAEPVFSLQIPNDVEGVPTEILIPRNTWEDKEAYDEKASRLARMFSENFREYQQSASKELISAGPKEGIDQ
jgi:phosphoenolpyruvate carboxykinase (ATP)